MFRKAIILFSFFLFTTILHADLMQELHELEISKIKGITDFRIAVVFDDGFEKETELSKARIENLISLRCRQSGVKLSTEAKHTFFIHVKFVKSHCCATYIEAELWSRAQLETNKETAIATVWNNWGLISGYTGKNLGQIVTTQIETFVEEFLNSYLEANPREFIQKASADQ